MNGQEYLDLLKARYSVRSFSDVQLTDAELDVLLQAAQLSPTAKNSQPFRLCVVQSAEGLAKIDEATRCRYGAPTVIIGAYVPTCPRKGSAMKRATSATSTRRSSSPTSRTLRRPKTSEVAGLGRMILRLFERISISRTIMCS